MDTKQIVTKLIKNMTRSHESFAREMGIKHRTWKSRATGQNLPTRHKENFMALVKNHQDRIGFLFSLLEKEWGRYSE